MIELLTDPFGEEAVRLAMAEIALLGVTGGALGCWIIFYGLSYSAESLAHGLFPGLVAAALLGLPLLAGGAAGLLVAALAVAVAARAPAVGRDTAVAVVVTSLLGLGVLLALSAASPPGLQELLFGDILGVTRTDLAIAAGLAVGVLAALRLLHGQLLVVGFDRGSARSLGGRPLLADAALLVLIALAVLVAVQGMGNLLVVAVLVAPAATARLLTHRMVPMMIVAAAIAVLCGAVGLAVSYHASTAAGASIAGVMVLAHLAGLGFRRVRGPAAAAVPR
ncbi:MAG TPA: metal ABC transporter permease [Solirubrobacteraceae bacterium]|nr:metal ABC transporter permease [Solirubrobacteraceae bacterium]